MRCTHCRRCAVFVPHAGHRSPLPCSLPAVRLTSQRFTQAARLGFGNLLLLPLLCWVHSSIVFPHLYGTHRRKRGPTSLLRQSVGIGLPHHRPHVRIGPRSGYVVVFLRRVAVSLFAITLACNVGYTMIHAATTNFVRASGGSVITGVVIAWVTLVAVVLYARRLAAKGILS